MLYPIYCAYMLSQSNGKLFFRTLSGRIYKFNSNIELILALIQKSTGIISADDIVRAVSKETGLSVITVADAINDLVTCRILADSHEQLLLYHSLTYNPSKYPPVLSLSEIEELTKIRPDYIPKDSVTVAYSDTKNLTLPIYDVLKKRHSCRDFLKSSVEVEKLFAICKASYSFQLNPVASAGALYPLSVYFINRVASGQLPVGLYQYDPLNEKILLLSAKIFPEKIQYSLNDADNIFDAPDIFFVCADVSRHIKKYANRGYRYTLLEVGHAVQNMTIASVQLGLGSVEYGGFYDEAVKRLFQMPKTVLPLACYAVGYEDTKTKRTKNYAKKEHEKFIIEKIVHNEELNVSPFLIDDERFKQSNLQVVVSRFEDACGSVDFGTGAATTYDNAYVKSIMEVYERYALSWRYFDQVTCADKLNGKFLDPREYVPYSDNQLTRTGFAYFRTGEPIEWLQGYDLNGECVYIPADLCFDVAGEGNAPYHVANTSGCAAHFNPDVAAKLAILELIERDAIVKNWIYRETPYQIKYEELPDNIKQRIQRYKESGISIFILSLPCEYAFTVVVCSVNDLCSPFFVSGAAASFFSVTEAVVKAFNEWEISFVLGDSGKGAKIIAPEEVLSPKDHGNLYRYANYNSEIDYLLHGQQITVDEVVANQLGNISALAPVFFSYRPLVENVHVVRAFSKELIPINFGYGMDFLKHSRIERHLLKGNEFPHYFA